MFLYNQLPLLPLLTNAALLALPNTSSIFVRTVSLSRYSKSKPIAFDDKSGLDLTLGYHSFQRPFGRFDAPRCHRNTRAMYLDRLELWMLGEGEYFEGKRLIWLHGGAGAGKSAILQSIAERCVQHAVILGNFFFSRADPSRNYAEVLIPTLAYRLARNFPQAMTVLEPIVQGDPFIYKASLTKQSYELQPSCPPNSISYSNRNRP